MASFAKLGKGNVVETILSVEDSIATTEQAGVEFLQNLYQDRAVWKQTFIDQSQSLNIHMTDANSAKVSSMHFYGWKKGLKTGMYYLRTKAAVDAIQFTLEKDKMTDMTVNNLKGRAEEISNMEQIACSIDSPDDCLSCGS